MKLFLCEKPSQAQDIGSVVFGGNANSYRKQGYLQKGDIAISWAYGHILTDAAPEKYGKEFEKWDLAPLPLIPQKWIKEVPEKTAGQLRIISNLLKKATEVIIATDADREGEVIAREILDYCRYSGKISRFWTSGLDEKSVRSALGKIKPDSATKSLYFAGLARQRADWLWGMNLSRAYTVAYGTGKGSERVLSVGRIQTPTLALIVRRDNIIENFEPYEHYGLTIECEKENGQSFLAHYQLPDGLKNQDGYCVNLDYIKQLSGCLKGLKRPVTESKLEHKKAPPPLPYSLSELQKEASRKFNVSAGDILNVAQALYEKHKLTSYPRTPCQYLPTSQKGEVAAVFNAMLAIDPTIAHLLQQANPNKESRVWNDTQVNKHSHHAIIPTMNTKGSISQLNALERSVYELIRLRYIAQFYPDFEYATQTVLLNIDNHIFKGVGRTPLKQGWQVLFEKEKEQEEDDTQSQMPQVKTGETVTIATTQINKKKTAPPPKFTEASLLDEMKTLSDFFKTVKDESVKKVLRATLGLGTEATRAAVIERLYKVGYIEKNKKHQLSATEKGKRLIAQVPSVITDPVTTAKWEMALSAIEDGKINLQQFMDTQEKYLHQLIGEVKATQKRSA
ncbi:MAG: DNA topoisomerase 3 [Neisseriaceae bacterium]|nr:DNA topoisomerase 3 [Neisseriaceae bacterium]